MNGDPFAKMAHAQLRLKQFFMGPNKTAFAFFTFVIVSSVAMGSYILVAPSSNTKNVSAQTIPTPFPTAIPTDIPEPTEEPTPTEEPEPTPTEEPTPTPEEPTPTPDPVAGWNSYTNSQYGYTIKYPLNWNVYDLGVLEPKVPSYIVFNQNTATTSARQITISVSTRTYKEQLAIGGSTGTPITASELDGMAQSLQDSDGNTSVAITLRRLNDILILRAKTAYSTYLYQMLPTLETSY